MSSPPPKKPDPNRLAKLCIAGPVLIRARGGSMGPKYSGEIQFRIQALHRRYPLPGTLLAWQDHTGGIVVHRLLIWAKRHGAFRYYCKGDANQLVDKSVVPDLQFVAEVTAVVRNGRESNLNSLLHRLGGLCIALRALPRATFRAFLKPSPTLH